MHGPSASPRVRLPDTGRIDLAMALLASLPSIAPHAAGAGFDGPALSVRALGRLVSRAEARIRDGRSANVLEETLSTAMAAAQAGNAEAYRRLLHECMPVIAATARGQGIRGEAVDDVVQETLLTIHRARASYDPARPFLPWLRAIAQRRAVDALRREARRPREAHDPLAYEAHADDALPAPAEGIERRQRDGRLAQAVSALPEGQRQAVEELALRERSLGDAAALTGRSKVALKVNLHRALKALRATLSDARRDGDV